MQSDPKNYHNKGQEDAAEGKYEPPHGIVEDLLTWTPSAVEKLTEENVSYNDGWRHTRDQKDN